MSSEALSTEAVRERIAMISPETLSPAQREVYDKIVAGPRGVVVGPLRVVLHSPQLADRWQALGEFLRYRTQLPAVVSELAIIMVGRYWNSQVEWFIHSAIAVDSGVPADVVEAIRTAQSPVFLDARDLAVYEYARELLEFGHVSDDCYARATAAIGAVALVELTGLLGYYTMVAMMLNAHDVPLPSKGAGSLLDLPSDRRPRQPQRLPAGQWGGP
ncbi:MAG: carboxymuconolactone decarboxylase family protein [Steroidobacteraceae bacterium]